MYLTFITRNVSITYSQSPTSYYVTTSYFHPGRFFRENYLSTRGKWIHLGKLLTVALIPIFGGWAFTLYSVAENVVEREAIVEVTQFLLQLHVFTILNLFLRRAVNLCCYNMWPIPFVLVHL